MDRKKKNLFKISLFIAFVLFIAAGVMREEVWDIISNATLLCFSCIGIK